jgi:WD40 repeat protein
VALNGEPARQSNFPAVTSVAVSPDGKTLVAPSRGTPNNAKLHRWSLPNLQVISGFDYWSPFRKLAFSPDGEFLASIWDHSFELRFAVTGGLDYRYVPRRHAIASVIAPGFVAFSPDSELCVFGWEEEFRVLDISTGTSRVVKRVDADFTDAAFTGSGQFFVTTHLNGTVKFWNPQTWEVVREYDWGCGMLTAIAFTADGSAGVCGTKQGQLVQFDIDD